MCKSEAVSHTCCVVGESLRPLCALTVTIGSLQPPDVKVRLKCVRTLFSLFQAKAISPVLEPWAPLLH